jgi:outer membrane protein assembly factor BamD (BamD/ComL family)
MHAARNPVQQSAALTPALAVTALFLLSAIVCAQATPPADQAPVAVPRAAATATAPAATQSAEEVLYQQITELRNLPRVTPGKQISDEPETKEAINKQLAKSLALTAEFLKKYPKSEYAEEILVQQMDTIRLGAVVNDKPLDEFRAEAKKILAGDASDKVKSTVAFMLVQSDLQDTFKGLKEKEGLSEEQKADAWKKAVVKQANDYIKKYPKSDFAKEFYGVLIETAVQDRNFDRAYELLDQLRASFPDEPAVPQIAQFIQQAAATQSAATRPGPATRPAAPAAGGAPAVD